MKYELSPSILSADFACLGEQINIIEHNNIHLLHIDIMDGHFVPNISFGIPIIKSIRKRSNMIFDIHLMVNNPEYYIDSLKEAGANIITVHIESCKHIDRIQNYIHDIGLKSGIALNPSTPIIMIENILDLVDNIIVMSVNPGFSGQKYIQYSYDKIKNLRKIIKKRNISTNIEVDGGITKNNICKVINAGANIIVVGSSIFNGNISDNINIFMNKINKII